MAPPIWYIAFDGKVYTLWKYKPILANPSTPQSFYYGTVKLAEWDIDVFAKLHPRLSGKVYKVTQVHYYNRLLRKASEPKGR